MKKTEAIQYHSATYRLFAIDELETDCEDYGQAVVYLGSVPNHTQRLPFDKHHSFETGRVHAVCGNTWHMLQQTRYAEHFDFIGDFSRHYGLFPGCGKEQPFEGQAIAGDAGNACC